MARLWYNRRMENAPEEKKGMPSIQKQYLSMMVMAVILVTTGIFMSVKAFRGVEKPLGTELSESERDAVVNIFSLVDAAGEMADSDAEAAMVTLKEAFRKLDEMDGKELSGGGKFRKESSAGLMAYAALAKIKDLQEDCGGVKEAKEAAERIMNEKYMVIPFRPVGKMTVMSGGEDFYETSRRKNTEIVKLRFQQEIENCK